MTRLALVSIALAVAAPQPISAAPPRFAETLTFEGVELSRVGTGTLEARALLTTVTICELAKYRAREPTQQGGLRLLVLRFARKLCADHVRQVFRGVVETQSGYSPAELRAFLELLPAVRAGSVLDLWTDREGGLEVFAVDESLGSLVAPQLIAALWAGLRTDD